MPAARRLHGWEDLPDHGVLHSVVVLLLRSGFYRELRAIADTCRSWRAAFCNTASSSPITLIPPLLLHPDRVRDHRPPPFRNNLVPRFECRLTGIDNRDARELSWEISVSPNPLGSVRPVIPLESLGFRGASYGHLVLSRGKLCVLVDVFTGATVWPPQLPSGIVFTGAELFYGGLTAPLASSGGAYLVVDTGPHNLFWRVGSHSWTRPCPGSGGTISGIVVFKGEIFGMNSWTHKLLRVDLTQGEILIREVRVRGEPRGITGRQYASKWLVACEDMLLMVVCQGVVVVTGETFQAFRLDTSVKPAAWVEVERLENWAIFLSTDKRCQPLCCASPEAWGGRSNCVYLYSHENKRCVASELGKPLQENLFVFPCSDSGLVHPMFCVPSMLYLRH